MNKEEIKNFINKLYNLDERIIDIIVEVKRRYNIEYEQTMKLLNKEQKIEMKEQELNKYKTIIKGN
jgi:hypothetical protein